MMTSKPIFRRDVLAYAAAAVVAPRAARARERERTVIEDVARWVVDLRYEDLPPNVVARAKRVVFDSLGCALGAIDAEPVRIARQAIALEGGNAQATLVGIGARVACDQAAFLN